jgi:hypothetical protein
VNSLVAVLDEAQVAASLNLQLLDDELVASSPPLCDKLRIRAGAPDFVARRVEDSLDPNLAI